MGSTVYYTVDAYSRRIYLLYFYLYLLQKTITGNFMYIWNIYPSTDNINLYNQLATKLLINPGKTLCIV